MDAEMGRDDLEPLQAALGYRFEDRSLLETALCHRSCAYELGQDALASYERLEFLGDALLGFVVSDWLFRDDADAAEGVLSRRRQSVGLKPRPAVAQNKAVPRPHKSGSWRPRPPTSSEILARAKVQM